MTELNLYHMVFDLPERSREPDHYELLGVPRFSNNVRAIRDAAVRRQSELLKWQNYDDHKAIDHLQGEVVTAVQTLEQAASREKYDEELRRRTPTAASTATPSSAPTIPARPNAATAPASSATPVAQKRDGKTPVPISSRSPAVAPRGNGNTAPIASPDRKLPSPTRVLEPANRQPQRQKSNAPDWFARARQLKQEPGDIEIVAPLALLSDATQVTSPNLDPQKQLAAATPPPLPKHVVASSAEATIRPFRFTDFTDAIEALAGRLFLAVSAFGRGYEPVERAVFRRMDSIQSLLFGLLLIPWRILTYLIEPMLNRNGTQPQLAFVASSAWIRMRPHEQHPWVSGAESHRHIQIPDRCVVCNKSTPARPTVKILRIYDRQSAWYLFLMGVVIAYCGEPYLERWLFGPTASTTQYWISFGITYLASVFAMRPFVRPRSFALSSSRCAEHRESPFPIMTLQGSHFVLHVGSRDLQRDFDAEWIFGKPT